MSEIDTSTPEGKVWLRRCILNYLRAYSWVAEDVIMRHVENELDATGEDYMLGGSDIEDMLFGMVTRHEDRALDWKEQHGKPDAPLLYALTDKGRAEAG